MATYYDEYLGNDNNDDIIIKEIKKFNEENEGFKILHILVGSKTNSYNLITNMRQYYHEFPLIIEKLLFEPNAIFINKITEKLKISQLVLCIDCEYNKSNIDILPPSITTTIINIAENKNFILNSKNDIDKLEILFEKESNIIYLNTNYHNNYVLFKSLTDENIPIFTSLKYKFFGFNTTSNLLSKINNIVKKQSSILVNHMDFTGRILNYDIALLLNNNVYSIEPDCLMDISLTINIPLITQIKNIDNNNDNNNFIKYKWFSIQDSLIYMINKKNIIKDIVYNNKIVSCSYINNILDYEKKFINLANSLIDYYVKQRLIPALSKIMVWLDDNNYLNIIPKLNYMKPNEIILDFNNLTNINEFIIPIMQIRCSGYIGLPIIINFLETLIDLSDYQEISNVKHKIPKLLNPLKLKTSMNNLTIYNYVRMEYIELKKLLDVN